MNFKNNLKIVLLSLGIFMSINLKAQYCTSTAAYVNYEYISRVTLGAIDNQTGSNMYTDFSAGLSANLYLGESYNITIKTEKYYEKDKIACWIDWNQNETFEASESVSLTFSGIPSQQAIATGTIIPPLDASLGATRMRILLVDNKIPEPCLSFDYGEVEDYTVNVISIDAPPQANFIANRRVIYVGESVEFTDISSLVPTSWKWIVSPSTVAFTESTDANSKNPVITFNESGNYSITLEATNGIGTDDTLMVDYIEVKDFGRPHNLSATTEGKHVNLSWDAPNISGVYNYVNVDEAEYILNPGPQRATKYSADDFNFTYPVTLTQISGFFYQASTDIWNDASFEFKIYDKDTTSILYESGLIEAEHNKEIIHTLSSPLTLTDDFYVAIIPVSATYNPSNLGKLVAPLSTNTYAGEPGSWWQFTDETTAFEVATSIYIASEKAVESKYSYFNQIKESSSKAQVDFTLQSYQIYRNGSLIQEIENPEIKTFTDPELMNGEYEYYIKAVYDPFGVSPESDTVKITVDNTEPEMMLIYNDSELLSGSLVKLEDNVLLGTTQTLSFGIYNEGQTDLTIDNIQIDQAEFQISGLPLSIIPANDTSYFTIDFTPLTDGVKTARVSITNNDLNENPYSFEIRAVGGLDKWTWMVYMLEDNTGLSGSKDINEWEVNGSIEGQVNYLVLYDSDIDSKDGIYYVKKDPDGFNYTLISDRVSTQFGIDPDLSDPEVLEQFILWAKDEYPAQHYGLTMWDHGSGIFKKSNEMDYGIQKDFVGDMKLWEMSKAVETFVAATNHKIDVIGFDVCLLGQLETAYQFKDLADYVVASELTEPGDGWNYWTAFEPMTSNPDITPEEIAISITNTYVESYQPGGWQYQQASTQAATSIEIMNTEFIPVFNDFSDKLGDLCYDFKPEITAARNSSWAAVSVGSNVENNPDHRDLGGFLKTLAENKKLPSMLTESAQNTLNKYNEMIVAEGHTESITNGATGLKIWMPERMTSQSYNNTYYNDPVNYLIISYTQWDEYLRKYENPANTNAPVAEFYIQDTIEQGMTVQLTNRSYFGPTSYSWEISPSTFEFVNSTGASSKTPEVKFNAVGKYTIKLTVSNSYGSDDEIQNECVEVIEPTFVAPGELSYTQNEHIVTLNWSTASGTPVLDEGFEDLESFPPAGWAIMSNDNLSGTGLTQVANDANTWGWCDENSFEDPQYIHTGDYSAAISYKAGETGDPFNWLITPEITLRSDEQLSFWLWYASDPTYYTDFDVMIYSDGQWTSLVRYTDGSGINLYNEQIVLSLSDYNEKTVKIAFVYQYTDGYQLAIDDIVINNSKDSEKAGTKKSFVKPVKANNPVFINTKKDGFKSDYIIECINVYRDGVEIGKVDDLNKTSYTDTLQANGNYSYYITMKYSEPSGESEASNTVNVSVNTLTNIENLAEGILNIYPNPASEYIQIELPEEFIHGLIQIFDLSGRIVIENWINKTNSKLNISELKAGLYLVKLTDNNNVFTNRLIIK